MIRRSLQFAWLTACALLLLGALGCKEPKTARIVQRAKTYKAIVSLSPAMTEIALGFGMQLLGRTSACNYPDVVVNRVPVVGGVKPDYEALARIKPDLVLMDAELYSEADKEKIKALGGDVVEFNATTLEQYEKDLFQLAAEVGTESTAQTYIDKVYRERQKSKSDAPPQPVKAAILLPGPNGNHMIAGIESFQADVLNWAGATPIGPKSKKFEVLSPEFLVTENPDLILVAGKPDAVLADPKLASINAVKNAKIFGLPQDVVLRRGFRVNVFVENAHKAVMLVHAKEIVR